MTFRSAEVADLPTIVAMLADDPMGVGREARRGPVPASYEAALAEIRNDPNHDVLVAELDGSVVGVLQLSFLPHLTYGGGRRAQIEGVRVSRAHRSRGVGRALLREAIGRARHRGCHLVQLTTDRRRDQALRFYESLGFEATHHGMKLHLLTDSEGVGRGGT